MKIFSYREILFADILLSRARYLLSRSLYSLTKELQSSLPLLTATSVITVLTGVNGSVAANFGCAFFTVTEEKVATTIQLMNEREFVFY